MQKVVLENFGPIRSIELDVKKFSILFGPQASGKSTLSKSVYFFKSVRDEIYEYIANHVQNESGRILTLKTFLINLILDLSHFLAPHFYKIILTRREFS